MFRGSNEFTNLNKTHFVQMQVALLDLNATISSFYKHCEQKFVLKNEKISDAKFWQRTGLSILKPKIQRIFGKRGINQWRTKNLS